jgi:hypothetical protein
LATGSVVPLVDRLRPIVADPTRGPEVQATLRSAIDALLGVLRKDEFDAGAAFSNEELDRRVNAYQNAAADLGPAMALLGYWAPAPVARVGVDAVAEVAMSRERTNGKTVWLDLYLYPATLLFYAFGLGATAGESHDTLARLCGRDVRDDRDEWRVAAEELNNAGALRHEVAQRLPGMERRHSPASDWLYEASRPMLSDLVPSGTQFERLFDRFEVLVGLGCILAARDGLTYRVPTGRFTWRGRHGGGEEAAILEDPVRDPAAQALADRFGRTSEELVAAAKRYAEVVARARGALF